MGVCRIGIISGVGVRKYYEKLGYTLQGVGNFMVKDLSDYTPGNLRDADGVGGKDACTHEHAEGEACAHKLDDEEELDVADSDLCT